MSAMNSKALPKRDEIDEKYKWNLGDMYQSIDKWENDLKTVKQLIEQIVKYKGTLVNGPEILLECLKASNEMMALNDMIYVYARMKRDEDNGNPTYQALSDRASTLSTEVYASISFIVPKITSIPQDVLESFISSSEGLKVYRQFFNEIVRQKEHILSEKEEEILALSSEMASSSRDIFTMFNNADLKFPFIKDENGEDIELTKGRYTKFLESEDRRVRKDAFTALYDTYGKFSNTLATSLTGNMKANKFYSTVSKYKSSLEASLDADNISQEVYDNLIDTVNNNLPLLHRYLKLRRKALKLEELHMYDLYVPIVKESKKNIPYEEALKLVEQGLSPMGDEYIGYLKEGFNSGWVDVFENQGKTSGAYSWGAYKSHPYVLLNYQGTINDVFTIAHEMGHALHSYYTNKTQPYVYSEYKIFVAEVASTVNESLLMEHLLKNTSSKEEKAYLLNHYLEQFRGTIFRQVMFAEFEKITHSNLQDGEALTADVLSNIYLDLNKKYFEAEVSVDDAIKMEWARIPHFYTSFYVYKYATGFSSAVAISNMILNEGKPAIDRYKEFLKGGSSDYPLDLLKRAGVDLYTPKPVQDALDVFEKILTELEALI
ncbi:oligoendopeptidase F [Acetivibrio cellulolyticus]|uniref:oligoendopeptidase F n=1 Tax=Acetivibrio cellulolyticus TaxID=35830 RepID=UPI0001E2FB33|nr:oligoendopeptidase F [Acetivibrio cellulolyticus]